MVLFCFVLYGIIVLLGVWEIFLILVLFGLYEWLIVVGLVFVVVVMMEIIKLV